MCACVCVCACIAQIPSLLDAEGKMMGAGREQQSNRAFKPPVRRREIRIFFSLLFFTEGKRTQAFAVSLSRARSSAKTPPNLPAELQYCQFQGRSGAGRWIK